MTARRQKILDTVADLAVDFIAYARRNDEDLPLGEIEAALEAGEIDVNQIVEAFRRALIQELG
jgi:hypothetical protein